jgi:archaellum component FlaC
MASYSGHTFSKHFIAFVNVLEELVNTRDTGRLFEKLAEKKDELQTIRDHCEQLSEFVKDQFKDYETIRGFAKENAQNFSNLDPDDIEKSEKLKTYFSEDDLPFDSFPQIKKIYTELVKAIAEHKNKLKEKAKTEYKAVYKIVEESAKATGVSEDIFPDWEKMNQKITAEDNISKLELMISNSGAKQAQWLKTISDKSGKETVTFKISSKGLPSQIETKDDLNNYIGQLRTKLEVELDEGKTIIIE